MVNRTAVLTLSTPLHHGSEKPRIKPDNLPLGAINNYTPHRRLPVLLKSGDVQSIVDIPAVSGNSIRHLWRESLVDITLYTLGIKRKDLGRNILETLVSGGGMEARDAIKTKKKKRNKRQLHHEKMP